MESIAISGVLPALVLLAVPAALRVAGPRQSGPESLALAAGLCLAWCMAGGMLLGALGALAAPAVWGWLALGIALSAAAAGSGFSPRAWCASWRGWSGAWLLVPPTGFALLLASPPPWYRDSLVYHLALPRHFARAGGFAWPDDNLFAAFPLGWESALALLHALGGAPDFEPPFNPRLAGVWTLAAAALATAALARSAGARPLLASTAGALLLLLPTAVEFGASTYVENALLLYTALALGWVLRAREGEVPWWGSAVAAGLACWIKYPALALLAFLAVAAPLLECLRRGERDAGAWLRRALRWSALAGAVASPFYLRNLIWRGNPIFPTGYALFGGEGWDDWRAWAYGVTLSNYGRGGEALDWLLLPGRLFSQRSFEGGFEGSLGPLLALGLPLALWAWLRAAKGSALRRHAPLLLAWVAAMSLFWALTLQQARFYLVAAPASLALLAAAASSSGALAATASSPGALAPAWRQRACAALLLVLQLAWSFAPLSELWTRQATGDWLAGRLSRDAFLARMLPESWPALREVPAHVPEDGRVWLVWMRGYTYYLPRPYRLDNVFEAWRLEALLDAHEQPAELRTALAEAGISHLLVNHRYFLVDGNADLHQGQGRTQRLHARFERALEAGALHPVERWGPVALYGVSAELPRDSARR